MQCFITMLCCFVDVLLQFLKAMQFQRVVPRVYGACGRLVVVEHSGHPLSSYLKGSFEERAEFALQLLSLVEVFWVRIFLRSFFDFRLLLLLTVYCINTTMECHV